MNQSFIHLECEMKIGPGQAVKLLSGAKYVLSGLRQHIHTCRGAFEEPLKRLSERIEEKLLFYEGALKVPLAYLATLLNPRFNCLLQGSQRHVYQCHSVPQFLGKLRAL